MQMKGQKKGEKIFAYRKGRREKADEFRIQIRGKKARAGEKT